MIVLLMFTCSAFAEEGGWKLPNLNPFSKTTKKKKSTRASVSDKGSGWHLPSMQMPTFSKPAMPTLGAGSKRKKPRSEPSMVTKMAEGTKNVFSKSVDAVTFWDNDSKSSKSSSHKRSTAHTARKDSSIFNFSHEDDERPINSVNDFLDAPRPQP